MADVQNRIHVLSQPLIDKIAAGEVIENPASVIKELVDNAIDAGAGRISIVVEDAGFSRISVSDDGGGIHHEDLTAAVLRHATSKISVFDDLYSLHTMGFRGEALASMAAVSRLEIVSSDNAGGLAHRLCVEGSECGPIEPASRTRGTTVTVRDLFFNTPARRKFMKTRKAEHLAILRLCEQVFMPFPAIHFTLVIEGRTAIDTPPVGDARSRIAQIAGTAFAQALVECPALAEGINASLFVSAPDAGQIRPRYQNLYVNLRKIESETVTYAVRNAFQKFAPPALKPSFFCFLDIDPGEIDVNVHPAKARIKFGDERRLFGAVYRTVERGIKAFLDAHAAGLSVPRQPGLSDALFVRETDAHGEPGDGPAGRETAVSADDGMQVALAFPARTILNNSEKNLEHDGDNTVQLSQHGASPENWDLISCYQIHDIFILAPIKNGILLIDQHAAHERILFEQALENLQSGHAPSQQLLFPITMELPPTEKTVVTSNLDFFRKFGYEVQDFGGRTVSISAIPAFIRDSQVTEAVGETVRYLLDERNAAFFPERHARFAAAFACGCAMKAGQKLSHEEMNALLNSLFATKNPYNCPHGRPTIIRISIDELKRRFLR